MPERPVVLVHGYSDSHRGFRVWKEILDTDFDVRVASYKSLTNEISIKDIAEGFDRALRCQAGLDQDQDFDAIVHSTGMLVLRSWLTTYPRRKDRLKHLIALAPATWGSPLAHKGRSWLGSVFKGSKNILRPDFLEAGDGVLDGLELGSRFTWDLAHRDLFGAEVYYGSSRYTPYVFTFCGTEDYGGVRKIVNEPGTDGTVRLAGVALNSRKAIIDLTERPQDPKRAYFTGFKSVDDLPVVLIDGVNHGTIMSRPTPELVQLVRSGLKVGNKPAYDKWLREAERVSSKGKDGPWQQFVVRLVDERGDPIPDYNVRLFEGRHELHDFTADVHAYSGDKSLRNFHVNVSELADQKFTNLRMRLIASSGTQLVGYVGYGNGTGASPHPTMEVVLDITNLVTGDTKLFYPFTTTLVEIKLNREPLPLNGESRLCRILREL